MTTKKYKGQHIRNVIVTNYMKIVEVDISLDGELSIKGMNKNGKTSLIDAMRRALGSLVAKRNKQPIRLGEEFAEIILELDNMVVTWYMEKGGKQKLKVMNKKGHYFKSPDAMMKELMGKMAYNPQEFMNLHPLKQKEIAISMLDTGEENIEDLDKQRQKAYDNRTDSNREVKQYETLALECGYIDPSTPKEEISVVKLTKKLTSALAIEDQHKQDVLQKARNEEVLETKLRMIESLRIEMKILYGEVKDLTTSISNYEDPNSELIQNQIKNADDVNKLVRNAEEKNKYTLLMNKAKNKSNGYTDEIDGVDEAKAYILKNANLPVEGMGFNERGITINGIDLENCSAAEQRELTMGIYFNTAPTGEDAVNVVFIEDGSLFDKESLDHIKQLCDERGFQLIIEIVGTEEGTNQVIIENGEVKS